MEYVRDRDMTSQAIVARANPRGSASRADLGTGMTVNPGKTHNHFLKEVSGRSCHSHLIIELVLFIEVAGIHRHAGPFA